MKEQGNAPAFNPYRTIELPAIIENNNGAIAQTGLGKMTVMLADIKAVAEEPNPFENSAEVDPDFCSVFANGQSMVFQAPYQIIRQTWVQYLHDLCDYENGPEEQFLYVN